MNCSSLRIARLGVQSIVRQEQCRAFTISTRALDLMIRKFPGKPLQGSQDYNGMLDGSRLSSAPGSDEERVGWDHATDQDDGLKHDFYYKDRVKNLGKNSSDDVGWCYPRYHSITESEGSAITTLHSPSLIRDIFTPFSEPCDAVLSTTMIRITGQIKAIRSHSRKLHFFDLEQRGLPQESFLQVMFNFKRFQNETYMSSVDVFDNALKTLKKGDFISVIGYPSRFKGDNPGVTATQIPVLMSPALHDLSYEIDDPETLSRRKHVHMRVDRRPQNILHLRAGIEKHIETYFDHSNMMRVRTPILAGSASGAVARPFETSAKSLPSDRLALRIAPELYLKRLIMGGCFGVYEMGPAFRNEGIDSTHNPEFTICEFYRQFTELGVLISMTEKLLSGLASRFETMRFEYTPEFKPPKYDFRRGFKRLSFIPVLEQNIAKRLGSSGLFELPNFEAEGAAEVLKELYPRLGLQLPSNLTLPGILDDLCGHLIEPMCNEPTWITHHPAVMSPLAKSFEITKGGQLVSARAELFIDRQEFVNCYEEENSPFEQRRKFLQQKRFKDEAALTAENRAGGVDAAVGETPGFKSGIDESYIEALEWGMPPTGGWGCGIDRLIMFFTGSERIADVLPFGTLKNVVAMGKPWRA